MNARERQAGLTALMLVAIQGRAEVARVLIAAGADVNARTAAGFTALQAAAKQGHAEVVELLRRAGATE